MVETSVIIPCYLIDTTTLKLAERGIASIRETADVELVLVDNNSLIGSEFLRGEADIYIKNKKNEGVTKAWNQGAKLSSCPYLLFGVSDIVCCDGWEQKYREILDNVPECGAVRDCGDIKDKPKNTTLWQGNISLSHWWMIKRETFFKIGFFDEDFFITWQDVDYTFRLLIAGLIPLITSEVYIDHYERATRCKIDPDEKEWRESKQKCITKWRDDPRGQELLKEYFVI